ncbi:uncharacterized protein [Amphiura filiformis]|uniref:uncharacterized protein n=1 Tax=Amphiura filiformis TaxID=82378 RepID=UPI003B21BC94
MKMNLVVLVAGIFIIFCNSANSESVDCIALCNECVEVSDTLTHMGCTKHCEEHKQNDNGKMSCSKLRDTKQEWFEYFGSNPSINRESFTTTAFGENTGMVWEDGIANLYQDDTLIGSEGYMHVYKRVNGKLLRFIEIYW